MNLERILTRLERIWKRWNALGTHLKYLERIWNAFGICGTHLERILEYLQDLEPIWTICANTYNNSWTFEGPIRINLNLVRIVLG